ncbi:polypeptide N-acetylgalactosaminyltransferase 5-like isoform X2 [Sitodiplosis mosellana]|uniref:polypeptide N-acetylgalactosaminyltransferase 5-like isoform X2 n=1 Tax=Sitodiplosis mosellana TaxID=263140 RepID=UPI002444C5CC|nr:polypeptide N-acetylgalactosaminyltransferase 5-like isoform X2 [Sitodiplosis mosellana]
MFKLKGLTRQTGLKIQRKRSFPMKFIKFIIVSLILVCLFNKMFSLKKLFRRRTFVVQKDLLDYNEDSLRTGWPFQITKHYDMYDLRTYTPKPKVISTQNLPGERGMAVQIPNEIMQLANWYSEYQINILASDKVAPKRSLPDFRDPKCLNIRYPRLLPSASVIIAVHNEAESVLLRAIWSVINRSPDELLEELILVDDFSDKEHMKEKLAEYLPTVSSKIKLVRTEKREGIVKARLIGAEKANGQVLIFLDANTECNDGWMEPLLSRIASDRSVVVTPRIDTINITTSAYEKYNDTAIYGFGWNLVLHLFPIPDREIARNHGDLSAPYRTPSLVGCATAIDREFFFEIGTFDTGMHIWGGDAAELSIRTWLCGGAVEIVPCSHVGHYFRFTPYSFNGDRYEVELRNNLRTVEVWMDQYRVYYDTLIQLLT